MIVNQVKTWEGGKDMSSKADRLSRSIRKSSMFGRISNSSLLMELEVIRQGIQGMKIKIGRPCLQCLKAEILPYKQGLPIPVLWLWLPKELCKGVVWGYTGLIKKVTIREKGGERWYIYHILMSLLWQ